MTAGGPLPRSVVVYDLEWTAWEGSQARGWSDPGEHREIVQIGAVRLTAEGFEELERHGCVVRPERNPHLSEYFTALTGITNRRVEAEGLDFPAAFKAFMAFVGDDTMYAYGNDHLVIAENCELNGLIGPEPARFVNLRPVFAAVLGDWALTAQSGSLPSRIGLPFDQRAHDAVADAAAVGLVARHLWQEGRLGALPTGSGS